MKRLIYAVCAALIFAAQLCAPVSAAGRYNYYNTAGDRLAEDAMHPSAIFLPGATVYADADVFTTLTAKHDDYPNGFNGYSCFGGDGRVETLTLGVIDNGGDRRLNSDFLENYVYSHIRYIKSIGGTMTGYKLITDYDNYEKVYYTAAVNISWDADGIHHYARFEPDTSFRTVIGYYDLAFPTGSSVRNDIPYMNERFSVAFEYQR